MKESTPTILSRLDERVKNFIDLTKETLKTLRESNEKEHKEIKSQIDDLCKHVNHEIEGIIAAGKASDVRILALETDAAKIKAKNAGRYEIYKALTWVFGAVLGLLGFFHAIGWF